MSSFVAFLSLFDLRISPRSQFLANFCCLVALLCGKLLQRFFFGPLQPREVEVRLPNPFAHQNTKLKIMLTQRLYDQTWMFVTESLLAFTIFRDEFDIPFGVMFGFLLFVKCFHWLMADRMESVRSLRRTSSPRKLIPFRWIKSRILVQTLGSTFACKCYSSSFGWSTLLLLLSRSRLRCKMVLAAWFFSLTR